MTHTTTDITKKLALAAVVALGAVAVAGCEPEDDLEAAGEQAEDAATEARQDIAETRAEAERSVAEAKADAEERVASEIQEKREELTNSAADIVGEAGDVVEDMEADMDFTDVDLANLRGDALTTTAGKMLERVETFIQDGQLAEARGLLGRLDAARANLPASVTSRLDQARNLLKNAEELGAGVMEK